MYTISPLQRSAPGGIRTHTDKILSLAPRPLGYRGKEEETEGFEPSEVLPSTVFKTVTINHSDTSPESNNTFEQILETPQGLGS